MKIKIKINKQNKKQKIKEETERKENEKKWMMDVDAVLMFFSEDLSSFGSLNEVWMLNLRPSRDYCVFIKMKNKRKKRL